jgi:hypothetical protein
MFNVWNLNKGVAGRVKSYRDLLYSVNWMDGAIGLGFDTSDFGRSWQKRHLRFRF